MTSQTRAPDWATGKPVLINKPEELVRQEFEKVLHDDFGYPKSVMDIEVPITRGSQSRERADLVIYRTTDPSSRDQSSDILGIVETKRKDRSDGVDQLSSYMSATSSIWGVWTNGNEIEFLYRDPTTGRIIKDRLFQVPRFGQTTESIGTHQFRDLKPASNLKLTFRRLLNELYTNTNISRREKLGNEMTKLLFCKMQDEQFSIESTTPRFRVGTHDHRDNFADVRSRIDQLFDEVKTALADEGVFDQSETILLENRSVAYVVGELQGYSLMQTDEDTVGSAFEVFAESKFAGEKGEFFTPREVVRTAIQIIDPKPGETIIDPACGSAGFLICALQHVWEAMSTHPRWSGATPGRLAEAKRQIAQETMYGLDKESDLVRIAKAYMAIIGDGKSRIAQANSLHAPFDFSNPARNLVVEDDGKFKQFDIILTNPPFGSKTTKVSLSESKTYDLGHKWEKRRDGKWYKTDKAQRTPAQELFVERCLNMLKEGGRMAIVLPETYAHAPTKKYILQYIRSRAAIRAVIDLPHNTFRPHCNAKTLLWILEKGGLQGDILFGFADEMGHDHHGKVKFRVKNGNVTSEVWNDMPRIRAEWESPYNPKNRHVLAVNDQDIREDVYVPRHYWRVNEIEIEREAESGGFELVPVKSLIEEGIIEWFVGHGAPPNQYKGLGNIPYVRVGDIGNWTVYKNPTAGIPRDIYLELRRRKILKSKDLVFVRDGSYRIGDVGIIMPSDTEILLDSHCLVLRVVKENKYDIDGLYLAYLLSHNITQRQLPSRIFINTTLPDIRDRWQTLRLPVSKEISERKMVKAKMERIYQRRHEAEKMIGDLKGEV